tara:strand:+ start:1203 stop:1562 length:360 start_codon:yes stop_codon:yes gene_type:complete
MTNEEFNKQWYAACTIALSGMEYRNKIPQAITLTEVINPPHLDAKVMQAVLTMEAHIVKDRIEGPILEGGANISKVFPWKSEIDDEDVTALRAEYLHAIREGRVYINHYHVTLSLPEEK